jgi:hypothetical protein
MFQRTNRSVFELYFRRLDVYIYNSFKVMTSLSNLWIVLCNMILEHMCKETGGYEKSM